MTYNGIIFDFNGTLLWDMDIHEAVWRETVQAHTGRVITEEEWITKFVGRTNSEIWPWILDHSLSTNEIDRLSEEKETLYRQRLSSDPDRVRLVDGAEDLFDLCDAEGISIAIATAAGRTNKDFYVKVFDLHRWFSEDRIVFDDGTMPGKPHPALFSKAMESLSLEPHQCIVVEDGLLGIQAARAAGAGKVYGMASSDAEVKKLKRVSLERILRSFREVDLADFQ